MNQNYLKAASFLMLLLLLGCQSQKAVLFAPQSQEAHTSHPLPVQAEKQHELPKVLCTMDSFQTQRPSNKKLQLGLRQVHQATAASSRAGTMRAKVLTQIISNRLTKEGMHQRPAEHEFPDLFIPAIIFGLLGGILLLVGLFTSGTVLLIGAVSLLVGFLMLILS